MSAALGWYLGSAMTLGTSRLHPPLSLCSMDVNSGIVILGCVLFGVWFSFVEILGGEYGCWIFCGCGDDKV